MTDPQKIAAILADPDWTERVVRAAAAALDVLNDGPTTPDGDCSSLPAQTGLQMAFLDVPALLHALNDDGPR